MASDYDASEFVDSDFAMRKAPNSPAVPGSAGQRAPSREEVDARVADAHQRLSELKRAQEELERERSALEETRRRQAEFQTGRQEMVQNLTRGVGLLEEAELDARREAAQLAKTLADFRDALEKINTIHEASWTQDNFGVELTRALTALENARMEWNSARLKFPLLAGQTADAGAVAPAGGVSLAGTLGPHSFGELCRIGFALTWPLALVGLGVLGLLLTLVLRR